ncbi:MAG TPA: hypothetical protein VMO47_17565 [Rhodothermales bacterium]|nr:hypothetical protein [Rhodothermales bacterium]
MSLWLPILLSAVIVFVASSIIHMVLKYHNSDFKRVPSQDGVMDALRPFNLPPGQYMLPHADTQAERTSTEFVDKMNKGPVALLTVLPNGVPNMATLLVQWFAFCVVVSIFAAYIASRAVDPGDDYLAVFRFAGCTAFVGYGLAEIPNSIWYKRPWSVTAKSVVDALIYGLLTGGVFGWLWP